VGDAVGPPPSAQLILTPAICALVFLSGPWKDRPNNRQRRVPGHQGISRRSQAGHRRQGINITASSYWTPQPPFVGYISTKGALNGFTHVLVANLANYDVTVNAVAPSLVRPATALRSAGEEFFTATVPMQDLKRSQMPTSTQA
jgi:NAD(P)-dependent dehydrogenase (short-subunit alcohol dehydrogenase family)